jgi:P27 family predicted phage terminase small subunit
MAGRGRPPKPLELKRLSAKGDGTLPTGQKMPEPKMVIQRVEDVPSPPANLETTGLVEWEKVWRAGHWLLPEQDYHWVAAIASAYDEIDHYRDKVAEDGLIQTGSMGQVIAHPLISEIRKCQALIMKCLSEIGFSPTARSKLNLAEVERSTGLADLMLKAQKLQ